MTTTARHLGREFQEHRLGSMSRIPGVELGTTCWQLLGHHTVLEYIPRGFPAEILGNIHFQVFPFGASD
jgi:hypothetical protein